MQSFHDRLVALSQSRGNLCVGLDPHPGLVRDWGFNYDVDGVERLARETIAAVGDLVAVFKPQVAFYECFGPAGFSALQRILADIRQAGALSILDVKRGDIGSTMSAYAASYFGQDAPLAADSVTLSPYLGFESLRPALDLANENSCGVYVLCRTSNPEGTKLQQARLADQRSIAQDIVDAASAENRRTGTPYVGLVVGATLTDLDVDLTDFAGSILAPGVGAQGGTIDGLPKLFGSAAGNVLPSVSRDVLRAGPSPSALAEAVRSSL